MNPSKIVPIVAVVMAVACIAVAPFMGGCQQPAAKSATPTSMTARPSQPSSSSSVSTSASVPSMSASMQNAQDVVESIVAPYGSSVAVAVVPLDGGKGFSINGDERFVSASMIKLLILAELMDEVDSGEISLFESHTVSGSEIVGGTGVISGMGSGTTLTYDQIAKYMIAESDNTATNILIDRLGMDSINAKARELGLSETDLQRYMMDLGSGVENHMSADDAAFLIAAFADETIASSAMSEKAIQYLCAQSDTEGIPAGVPSGVNVGNKTGSLDAYRHDAAVVFGDEPYVIAVFTKGVSSPNALMSSISQAVYDNLEG